MAHMHKKHIGPKGITAFLVEKGFEGRVATSLSLSSIVIVCYKLALY